MFPVPPIIVKLVSRLAVPAQHQLVRVGVVVKLNVDLPEPIQLQLIRVGVYFVIPISERNCLTFSNLVAVLFMSGSHRSYGFKW